MLYAIVTDDVAGSLMRRMSVQALHMARIKLLRQAGRLHFYGQFPAAQSAHGAGRAGFLGNMIVAEFESLKQAQDWSDADPFWEAGVYASVRVWPFVQALPQAETI